MTPLRNALSRLAGWAADRRVPTPLRGPIYRAFALYARIRPEDLAEVRLPLESFPSLGQFFVRELREGARPIASEPGVLCSPVDGTVQAVGRVHEGRLLQAKGRLYAPRELVGRLGADLDLEGACAWTIYLSPRDYHRIHAPEEGRLVAVEWLAGARWSVAPAVLARRLVLPVNERAVLRLETARGPFLLVLVGALNVGRIRVVGVPPGHRGALASPLRFARGAELARFEMGSTIVLIVPRGVAEPVETLEPGVAVRLGTPIGVYG
jgi:phosphatidylserine decarboxylase